MAALQSPSGGPKIRRYILFAVALSALLGGLVVVFATQQERNFQLRGYVDPIQTKNLPYRLPRLGVNAELAQYQDDAILRQNFDLMSQVGITWVRQYFPWDQIEPQAGQWEWQQWDRLIDVISDYPELRLIAVLTNSPEWSHSQLTSTDNPTAPPERPESFANFARSFAMRYGQTIDYYQLWDEPNLAEGWGGLEPRPVAYTALLQAGYDAIHSSDDNAIVIAAALAPTVESGPNNISDIQYLHDLYQLGAHEFADAFAAKPLGFNTGPFDRSIANEKLNFSRIVALREAMVRNHDGTKSLWASAWGWNSLPSDWRGDLSIWGAVTGENQIAFTLDALDRADREWPWLGGMILYHWQPDLPPNSAEWGFALLDQRGQPTALLQALMQRPPDDVAQNGIFSATNPFARYSGIWTFGALGADIGWLRDSQLDFDFAGSDVGLLLRQDNYVANLYPSVDGRPELANALPRDPNGTPFVLLTSNSLEPEMELVPIARSLDGGEHTLHLTAVEGRNRWALAGFSVSSGDLTAPYDRQIAVGWLTVLIAASAVIITGWNLSWERLYAPVTRFWLRLSFARQLILSAATSLALMAGMLLTWSNATPALFRREPVQLVFAFLTAGLIYLQPGLPLTIIAGLVLFLIIYNRHEIGLLLTLFWAPFFLFPVELYRFAFPISEVLVLITGAAWLSRQFVMWGKQEAPNDRTFNEKLLSLNLLDFALLFWILAGLVSLIWADRTSEAVTELRTLIFGPGLFYLVLRTTFFTRQMIVRLVDTLLLAGVVVALVSLGMYVLGDGIITAEDGVSRLAGVYGSPNNLGLYLGRIIPFALVFIVLPVSRNRRLAAGFALLVMAFATILSLSAGALFVGIPFAVAAVLLLAFGKHAWKFLGIVVPLFSMMFVFALRSPRFSGILDFSSGTNFFRLRVWQSSLHMIRDHPLTGLGLDQFLYAYRGQYIIPDAWQEPNLSHPHNIIFDFWLRMGVAGLGILAWTQVAFWTYARRAYKRHRAVDPLFQAITIGVMGSMADLLSHGVIDNSVYVFDLSYVFVLLLGLVVKLSNINAIDADD